MKHLTSLTLCITLAVILLSCTKVNSVCNQKPNAVQPRISDLGELLDASNTVKLVRVFTPCSDLTARESNKGDYLRFNDPSLGDVTIMQSTGDTLRRHFAAYATADGKITFEFIDLKSYTPKNYTVYSTDAAGGYFILLEQRGLACVYYKFTSMQPIK